MNNRFSDLEIERIEEFNNYYQSDDNGIKEEKRLNKVRLAFIRRFVENYIKNEMREEDYCIGQNKKDSFCYVIERELRGLGSILGANSSKFGLYWDKEKEQYIPTKKFGTTIDTAFDEIKKELCYLILTAKMGDLSMVSKSKFSYMIRHKIYYLYNYSNDIPIFCEEHIDKVLDYYEIEYSKTGDIEFNKRNALFDFKNVTSLFSNMSNRQFAQYLYSSYSGLYLKEKGEIDKNRKEEEVSLVEVSKLMERNTNKYRVQKKGKTNYDDVAAKKSCIGEAGEKLVLKYEMEHHPRYKDEIKRVSTKDDHLGYDVLSYDDNGNEVYIEVKTKKNGSRDNVDFYITDNELKKLDMPNHIIYYVCGIMKKQKTIYVIRKEHFVEVKPKPILYHVQAKIVN